MCVCAIQSIMQTITAKAVHPGHIIFLGGSISTTVIIIMWTLTQLRDMSRDVNFNLASKWVVTHTLVLVFNTRHNL